MKHTSRLPRAGPESTLASLESRANRAWQTTSWGNVEGRCCCRAWCTRAHPLFVLVLRKKKALPLSPTHTQQNLTTHVSSWPVGHQSRPDHFGRVPHHDSSGRGNCLEHGRCAWRGFLGGMDADRLFCNPQPDFSAGERAQNRTTHFSSWGQGHQSPPDHLKRVLHCDISGRSSCVGHWVLYVSRAWCVGGRACGVCCPAHGA